VTEPTGPLATNQRPGPAPATGRDTLRDRIATLFRRPPGVERLGDATPREIADAVLAALQEHLDIGDAEAWCKTCRCFDDDPPAREARQDPTRDGTCGHRSSDGRRCTQPSGHLGYHRNVRKDGNEWTSWVGDLPLADEAECCGAEPPDAWPGDY
jgi:hypothetical protein